MRTRVRKILPLLTLLGAGALSCATATAVDLPSRTYLPAARAVQAVQAAVRQCENDGYRISSAVVDRAGVVQAQLRADGAGSHTVDSSRKKAYTAASLGQSTQQMARMIADKPELQGLRDMNGEILMLGGGLPIRIGEDIVGGIGVGGAPGGHLDEACAKAGLQAIGALPEAE